MLPVRAAGSIRPNPGAGLHASLSIGNLLCSISCLLQPEPHHVRLRQSLSIDFFGIRTLRIIATSVKCTIWSVFDFQNSTALRTWLYFIAFSQLPYLHLPRNSFLFPFLLFFVIFFRLAIFRILYTVETFISEVYGCIWRFYIFVQVKVSYKRIAGVTNICQVGIFYGLTISLFDGYTMLGG